VPRVVKSPEVSSRARRHFLGLVAATSAKVAAIGVLASTGLISSAEAKNDRPNNGNGPTPSGNPFPGGANGGQFPGGGATNGQFPGGGPGGGGGPVCFLRGTAILTPAGEVPVEALRIGDLVETVRGTVLPIRWIGRQTFKKGGRSWPESVMPIRIARGALAEHTPHKDLYVSPLHALFLNGVLIPAGELVNGSSIVPALPHGQGEIEYFHIMLDSHEVVLAEGAPAETYLPCGNQESFSNFVEYERLYPGEPWPTLTPFAPLVGYGGRAHLKALLRLGVSPFVPVYHPLDQAYERLAERAKDQVS
jgi:hypothetical protein